eukprot:jgi/Tetstr1/438286/TSEL_026853.t1
MAVFFTGEPNANGGMLGGPCVASSPSKGYLSAAEIEERKIKIILAALQLFLDKLNEFNERIVDRIPGLNEANAASLFDPEAPVEGVDDTFADAVVDGLRTVDEALDLLARQVDAVAVDDAIAVILRNADERLISMGVRLDAVSSRLENVDPDAPEPQRLRDTISDP